jgi:hypothetical protein
MALFNMLPSPKFQTLLVHRPEIWGVKQKAKPVAAVIACGRNTTDIVPVNVPTVGSSHPMDGGFFRESPSMSIPDAYAEDPAPTHGELTAMW